MKQCESILKMHSIKKYHQGARVMGQYVVPLALGIMRARVQIPSPQVKIGCRGRNLLSSAWLGRDKEQRLYDNWDSLASHSNRKAVRDTILRD